MTLQAILLKRGRRLLLFVACLAPFGLGARAALTLDDGFAHPPAAASPWCYWYWVSDNISRQGITHDLESMAHVGISQAFIGNVDVDQNARGSVKVLSPEWWAMVEHAVREGNRLGVNIGLFNSPGWSQSGGPWVKPWQSMRYLAQSETHVHGPAQFSGKLPVPKKPFQDVAVLAFRAPRLDTDTLAAHSPRVHCIPAAVDAANLCDGNLATLCKFPAGAGAREPFVVDVDLPAPDTVRSLVLYPAPMPFAVNVALMARENGGKWRTVRTFRLDRSNPGAGLGPMHYGPVAIAFAPVTSAHFRLRFTGLQQAGGLAEIQLSGAPRLERYVEKQLGKMWQTPHPMWDAYLWPEQPRLHTPGLVVNSAHVLNLSNRLKSDGTLHWRVPAGDWVILRIGMTPTGVKNGPASPEATGLEIDKMNRRWVDYHFNAFVGQLLKRMPAADRHSFRHVVADSYEVGSENWTDGMARDFRKRYGYDPLRWLPVLTGRIVDSPDASDRFLWDLRRLVADRISYDYVGALRKESEKHGLRLWLENYGHWGFTGTFLQYGGQSDDVSGEFWTSGDLGSIELRDASSCAHIYGKRIVTAESWTSGGPLWTLTPWSLKKRGDWAMTEGINHFLLHVYIHQAYDNRYPGMNAWFGTEFNRHNTWFNQAGDWIRYLERSSFLLQQGLHVADAAYFIGEDAPKMTGILDPPLPAGRDYDWINAEVIERRLRVKNGRFVLPDEMSYRVLVLPPQKTMRPELLRKIRDLVRAGGVILGPRPDRSPSLQDYPACDQTVRRLAAELWQNCDGVHVTSARFGKGRVFCGVSLAAVFSALHLPPDTAGLPRQSFPWIHRATAHADIYFISNQSDQSRSLVARFRVTGRQPELWDAVTGRHRLLPNFVFTNKETQVPLRFAPRQSYFVVFRKPAEAPVREAQNFLPAQIVETLAGPWTVHFDPKWGGPASVVFTSLVDWTQRPESGIQHYSGTAKYVKTFDLLSVPSGGRLFLNLGKVHNLARVYLNGHNLGLVWCAPWQVDISHAVKSTGNKLEVDVINTWANRLIGDARLPAAKRLTWTAVPTSPNGGQSRLLPAGLIGPVTLQRLPEDRIKD